MVFLKRAITTAIAISCFSGTAIACRGPGLERLSILQAVPAEADAPVIIKITVSKLIEHGVPVGSSMGVAHVDQVIKGVVTGDTIIVRAQHNSCAAPLRIGATGFVIGKFKTDGSGVTQLYARSFSRHELGQ